MIIWINGAFGAGKTQTAFELRRRIKNSYVYDPENLGYFLRKNIPESINDQSDFQDYSIWRALNVSFVEFIAEKYDGVVIIPMTIVNPQYFNEIIGLLRDRGLMVKHFTLMVSKKTLLKRLRSRGDGAGTWPAQQADRCLQGLSDAIFGTNIDTDNLSVPDAAEKIAQLAGVELLPDRKSRIGRKIDRTLIQLRHVRIFKV